MTRRRPRFGASRLAVAVAPLSALLVFLAFVLLLRGVRYSEPVLVVGAMGFFISIAALLAMRWSRLFGGH